LKRFVLIKSVRVWLTYHSDRIRKGHLILLCTLSLIWSKWLKTTFLFMKSPKTFSSRNNFKNVFNLKGKTQNKNKFNNNVILNNGLPFIIWLSKICYLYLGHLKCNFVICNFWGEFELTKVITIKIRHGEVNRIWQRSFNIFFRTYILDKANVFFYTFFFIIDFTHFHHNEDFIYIFICNVTYRQ